MSSPNQPLLAPSIPPKQKRPDGSYIVHLDGEDLIITKAMIDETDPQIMREYLRMFWAQEHRERREGRCRDTRGVRYQRRCSVCDNVEERLEGWAL